MTLLRIPDRGQYRKISHPATVNQIAEKARIPLAADLYKKQIQLPPAA